MKYIFLSLLVFLTIACSNNSTKSDINPPNPELSTNPLQDNFSKLTTAIANGDKNVIKQFIKFPFSNPDGVNEIWFVAQHEYGDGDKVFTEKDFDEYFAKIFEDDTRPMFAEIDTKKLFAIYEVSKEVQLKKGHQKILNIEYNKSENIISINIIDNINAENIDSPIIDGESDVVARAVIFRFKIVNNTLELQAVHTAG